METDATKRIWKFTKHKLTDKLLFLALAQYANGEGTCFPSYDTLASMVGVNRRSAIRIVEKLVKSGELFYKPTVGRGNTNLYFIVVGLSSGEVKQVLTSRYDMTASEAQTVIDSLLEKGVIYDIKSVTDDTISSEQKVPPVTPLPINGVISDTRSKESINESLKEREESRPPPLDQRQELAKQITVTCGYDPTSVRNGTRQKLEGALDFLSRKRATPEQVKKFGEEYWWGKSPPRPDQLTEEWTRFLQWQEKPNQQATGKNVLSIS